jgi:hypothetical protein
VPNGHTFLVTLSSELNKKWEDLLPITCERTDSNQGRLLATIWDANKKWAATTTLHGSFTLTCKNQVWENIIKIVQDVAYCWYSRCKKMWCTVDNPDIKTWWICWRSGYQDEVLLASGCWELRMPSCLYMWLTARLLHRIWIDPQANKYEELIRPSTEYLMDNFTIVPYTGRPFRQHPP